MQQYLDLLQNVMTSGGHRGDRTGVGTRSVFGRSLRFNLQDGFPLLTIKQVPFKAVMAELVWFLEGSTNNERLRELGATIWDEWALPEEIAQVMQLSNYQRALRYAEKAGISINDAVNTLGKLGDDANGHAFLDEQGIPREEKVVIRPKGDLGPIYGAQWRAWPGSNNTRLDQLRAVVDGLKTNPYSRRHIVNAWNVEDLPDESVDPYNNIIQNKMALAPCHLMFQYYVRDLPHDKKALDCQVYIRSSDVPLGLPFNIASYAALTHLVAHECGYAVGELSFLLGDTHVYANQVDSVYELLTREPFPLPTFTLPDGPWGIDNVTVELLVNALSDYQHHPALAIPIAR